MKQFQILQFSYSPQYFSTEYNMNSLQKKH